MTPQLADWLQLQREFGEDLILVTEPEALPRLVRERKEEKTVERGPRKEERPVSVDSTNCSAFAPLKTVQETTQVSVVSVDLSEVTTLEALKERVLAFDGCALKKTATHTVFADGNPQSKILFIGEAPGAEEDKQGLPFVGPSGQLLDKMMASIGLSRQNAYITNVVFWRPPGNRPPTPTEVAVCLPFLNKHLELVKPQILVLLGMTATKALLKTPTSLAQSRGVWHAYAPGNGLKPIPTRVTFHPSYLLRSPGQKAQAWIDLMTIRDALETGDFYG